VYSGSQYDSTAACLGTQISAQGWSIAYQFLFASLSFDQSYRCQLSQLHTRFEATLLTEVERASLLQRATQSVPRISFQVLEPDNLFCPLQIEPVPLDLVNEYKIEFDSEKRCIKQGEGFMF
jgi:hypothetical protein